MAVGQKLIIGIKTELKRIFFGGSLRLEILEEIFVEMLLRKKWNSYKPKSLNEILTRMRNSTLLYGRVLLWIAYGSKSKLESWEES